MPAFVKQKGGETAFGKAKMGVSRRLQDVRLQLDVIGNGQLYDDLSCLTSGF
jgi:hypothetical protein